MQTRRPKATTAEELLAKEYLGRQPDKRTINAVLDLDEAEILYQYCGIGRKNVGRFIGKLLTDYAARVEERQKMRDEQKLQAGLANA